MMINQSDNMKTIKNHRKKEVSNGKSRFQLLCSLSEEVLS